MHVSSPHDGKKVADQEQCLPILDKLASRRMSGFGAPYDKVISNRYRQVKIRAISQFLAQVDAVPVAGLLERCVQQGSSVTRRFVRGLGRGELTSAGLPRVRTLTRSHKDLALDYRETGDSVALGVQTESGWVEELTVSRIAREAVAFCVTTPQFDVQQLPGRLTEEERSAFADALEESGLFALSATE
jgi:hypothetical protein